MRAKAQNTKIFLLITLLFCSFFVSAKSFAEDFIWRSTLSIPKGENFPDGTSGDIRGLVLGESYDVIKGKILAIQTETDGTDEEKTITESQMAIMLPVANGNPIEVRYPQQIKLDLTPSSVRTSDLLIAYFSAPSSGSQLVGVYRSINYNNTSDQPKISEVLAGMEAKFGGKIPLAYDYGSSVQYHVNFDAGAAWSEESPNSSCNPSMVGDLTMDERAIAEVNQTGRCDIVLNIEFRRGISADHAETIIFKLSDNERGRRNLQADFKYFMDYMTERTKQSGAAPKL